KEVISLGVPVFTSPGRGEVATRSGAGGGKSAKVTPTPTLPPTGGGRKYVEPRDWDALIANPEVDVLDARNSYEVHLGTFARAVDPQIRNFKQLPAFVKKHLDPVQHKKIATFCTGGIRCEKFSAWLLDQGFKEVYQLKGGILKYLEEIPEE